MTPMRIGLDFDNTIVSYDRLFHAIACERALVPPDLAPNKTAVRDHLRLTGREELWTLMQGEVYGERMMQAQAFPRVLTALRALRGQGHALCIVSHKTRHPYAGPRHDLHAAARGWIAAHLLAHEPDLLAEGDVHFELTKDDKLRRIGTLGCGLFVDDLPEFLAEPAFPTGVRRVLFDPHGEHRVHAAGFESLSDWAELPGLVETPQ